MSHAQREREHLALLTRQLTDAGVTEWSVNRTASHPVLVFTRRDGQTRRMIFSGTGDPYARQRNRQNLRKLLNGTEQ